MTPMGVARRRSKALSSRPSTSSRHVKPGQGWAFMTSFSIPRVATSSPLFVAIQVCEIIPSSLPRPPLPPPSWVRAAMCVPS